MKPFTYERAGSPAAAAAAAVRRVRPGSSRAVSSAQEETTASTPACVSWGPPSTVTATPANNNR